MMSPAEIRLKQNPILTNLLLGMGQGTFIAEKLFPRLPHTLSSVVLAKLGKERLKRYNLRRAPGAATKRVNIKYEGKVYTVDQYSVEVPMPRELLREADESRRLQVGNYLDVSHIAMTTASDILALDYELEAAALATDPDSYAVGNVQALSGGTKWSAATGTPVADIRAAAEVVRGRQGVRPNLLTFSAPVFEKVCMNQEVRSYLPSSQLGPATVDQLKTIFNVPNIAVGDAVWVNDDDEGEDVWGNNAILAYVPNIGATGGNVSLAQPAFGFTNVIEGHPFAETPYFENGSKSWIYGATYERKPNIAYDDAAFLFQNPA